MFLLPGPVTNTVILSANFPSFQPDSWTASRTASQTDGRTDGQRDRQTAMDCRPPASHLACQQIGLLANEPVTWHTDSDR